MLKIEKNNRNISFMWEKDDEPEFFEQLQTNVQFSISLKNCINIPIKITPSKVVMQLEDIKLDREFDINNIKRLEILFNDFFNTKLYCKYPEDTDFNFNYWKLSIDNEMKQPERLKIYSMNGNLYTLIQGSYYLSRISSIIENGNPTGNLLIVGQKEIKPSNKVNMVLISNKKEYASVADLLADL